MQSWLTEPAPETLQQCVVACVMALFEQRACCAAAPQCSASDWDQRRGTWEPCQHVKRRHPEQAPLRLGCGCSPLASTCAIGFEDICAILLSLGRPAALACAAAEAAVSCAAFMPFSSARFGSGKPFGSFFAFLVPCRTGSSQAGCSGALRHNCGIVRWRASV